ncbi:hypothetical protein NDU88_001580 [Pleurodeles waltl]|uniref:Uncharacterized protein n=1 Tax=Pleurodeles waltl TaxID=8319 RepID=A0AAV7TI80_PLEWA|nr:hypothetical protein NDU88_001580 [Pleurodeles waltl]
MGRVVTNVSHHESWRPATINKTEEYAKRKRSNDRASRHRKARHSDIQVGDSVLHRDRFPGSKFHLPFEDRPWTVTNRQGSMVVAKRGSEQVVRNISWFKKFQAPRESPDASPQQNTPATEMSGSEEDEEPEHNLTNPAPNNTDNIAERPDWMWCRARDVTGTRPLRRAVLPRQPPLLMFIWYDPRSCLQANERETVTEMRSLEKPSVEHGGPRPPPQSQSLKIQNMCFVLYFFSTLRR